MRNPSKLTFKAEYSSELPAAPKISYLTNDHLGSPRLITDEGGMVVSRHDYRAFGDEILAGTANRTTAQGYGSVDEIRKQYTGYERDTESGLDFAQARYYNSAHGRFTSVDPLTASASIRNPQTFNRYAYVLNSPYKFTGGSTGDRAAASDCGRHTGSRIQRFRAGLAVSLSDGAWFGTQSCSSIAGSRNYASQQANY
jgi:RHS repeat-associated protein